MCAVMLASVLSISARTATTLFRPESATDGITFPAADQVVNLNTEGVISSPDDQSKKNEFAATGNLTFMVSGDTKDALLTFDKNRFKLSKDADLHLYATGQAKLKTLTLLCKAQGTPNAAETADGTTSAQKEGDYWKYVIRASDSDYWYIRFRQLLYVYYMLVEYETEDEPAPVGKYAVSWDAPQHATLVIKAGDTTLNNGAEVDKDTEITITATPETDYKIDGITVNGQPAAASVSEGVMSASHTVVAATTVAVTASKVGNPNPDTPQEFTVTGTVTGRGTVTMLTPDGKTVESGASLESGLLLTIMAQPDADNTIGSFSINGVAEQLPAEGQPLVKTRQVDDNLDIVVTFVPVGAPVPDNVTVSWTVGEGGSFNAADSDGKMLTSGSTVPKGSIITLTAVPAQGYTLSRFAINSQELLLPESGQPLVMGYTVNDNSDIDVTFVRIDAPETTYPVTWQSPVGAVILVLENGQSITSGKQVAEGQQLNIIVSALPDFKVTGVTVNDQTLNPDEPAETIVLTHIVSSPVHITATTDSQSADSCTVTIEQTEGGYIHVTDSKGYIRNNYGKMPVGTKIVINAIPYNDNTMDKLLINGAEYLPSNPAAGVQMDYTVTVNTHITARYNIPTGIPEVDMQNPDNVEFYDLQGRRVKNPRPGLYIIHTAKGNRPVRL